MADLDEEIEDRVSVRKKLNQLLELFVEQFGGSSTTRTRRNRSATKKQANPKGTAKEQIHAWLKDHQGSPKKEIIAGTGLKEGTVGAYLSTEERLFERRDDGWHAL